MKLNNREYNIFLIEEFYCSRMEELVEEDRFDDSHSIFGEFVVDGEEPGEWMFLTYLADVC